MTVKRPDPKHRRAKTDVMQAALQVEAFTSAPEKDPALLDYAEDAASSSAAPEGAEGTGVTPAGAEDAEGAHYDEHDWDDVVQQTFPASDAPPPPGG